MSPQMGKVIFFMGVGKPLELREFPVPDKLEPGAILVKISLATVCGSDMHTWKGRRPFPTPSVLGHEAVGTIDRLGPEVDRDTAGKAISVGDRITWTIMSSCGVCYFCKIRGLPQKCLKLFKYGHVKSDVPPYFTGTFGQYVYIKPGTGVFKLPDELSDKVSSPLMCAAATVAGGLKRIGVGFGDNIVIQGAGMLGLYAGAFAKEMGAKQVIMIDILEERLQKAKEFGAEHCLNAQKCSGEDLVEKVKKLTDGFGADVVVEVSGFAKVIQLGVKMLGTGGRYLIQGAVYPNDEFTIDSHDVIVKCLTLAGLHNYDAADLGMALDIVKVSRDKYPFGELAGPEFPLTVEGVTAALKALEKREAIRPIIIM